MAVERRKSGKSGRSLRPVTGGLFDREEKLDAPIKGPLFPRPVVIFLVAVFGVAVMLAADWFGLLLLNSGGVVSQMGPLNVLRTTAVFMAGVAAPSVLLMFHYRRLYSYVSEENLFFAITFFVSFALGLPCGLVGLFG